MLDDTGSYGYSAHYVTKLILKKLKETFFFH